jgi:CRISPR system Cascade subunit CasB
MTTAPRTSFAGSPEAALVGATVEALIRPLQRGYRNDHPPAVATLARLRRGAGRPVEAVPDVWGLTGMDDLIQRLDALPGEESKHLNLDHAEGALHLAMTLWALHQQSHQDMDMHVRGRGLGSGVRALMAKKARPGGDGPPQPAGGAPSAPPPTGQALDEPLRRRFVRVSTATSLPVLGQRLREIVELLRGADVPLDYALLAGQVYRWQTPSHRADVHRAWGRDFHLAAGRGNQPAPTQPPTAEGAAG